MFDRKEYEGKRALRRWPKWLPVVAALALATAVTVGGTLAWLSAHTNSVTNTFTMGNVDPDVEESFSPDHTTKSDIKVTNNGSVEAYVRVALVFSWRDGATPGSYDYEDSTEQPGGTIVADTPVEGTDYTFTPQNTNDWIKGTDGYYYYKYPVKPNTNEASQEPSEGSQTSSLGTIEVIENDKSKEYNLDVQVLADSIQAAPETAVTTMWGTTKDGSVTGVDSDGNLTINSAN